MKYPTVKVELPFLDGCPYILATDRRQISEWIEAVAGVPATTQKTDPRFAYAWRLLVEKPGSALHATQRLQCFKATGVKITLVKAEEPEEPAAEAPKPRGRKIRGCSAPLPTGF